MTQFDAPFNTGESVEPKTSGLAIASLVCSLICCVPVTTIPGILLGVWAMLSISHNPARRGKGVALAGILLGVIFTAGQAYVYPPMIKWVGESIDLVMGGPDQALVDGFAGDPATFKSHFYGTGLSASDAEAQAFIDTLRSRYGEYGSCTFDQQNQPPPSFGQSKSRFAYDLRFENATVDAEAQIIWVDERTGDMVYKFGWVKILDPDLGDLTYPAGSSQPSTQAGEGATDPADTAPGDADSPTTTLPDADEGDDP
jgi:hypothetical protein